MVSWSKSIYSRSDARDDPGALDPKVFGFDDAHCGENVLIVNVSPLSTTIGAESCEP